MKILRWISDNILFLVTLFLLVFIPLYPKKPLLDVVNTWVYVRAEDFIVLSVLLLWITLLFRKKITLKTPLTMPILLFWIAGAVSTIHGVLLIFPGIANVFPNVAFLSMLRRIEYISLFFIAFAGLKDKRALPWIVAALTVTLFFVFLYGMGQKYFGFPAYLTMNEEFAKGAPIQLSALSRVPSTFGGHYDLAAYLVLVIPIVASMIFGFRNWFIKILLFLTVSSGFILLFMTVSRVSFFVVFISLAGVLFFHKKRWVIFSLPIVAILFGLLFLIFSPRLINRFGSTVKEIDVLVNAQTGEALGNIKEITPINFKDKIVKRRIFRTKDDIDANQQNTTEDSQQASSSAILPYVSLPAQGVLLVPPNASTGENLPQGTGYTNLSLSPVRKQLTEFFYQSKNAPSEVLMFSGKFLIKRASAYDLSFTTRYQGEWPHAIEAFKRNIFLGSGYSSISLAIDNSYLRMLGEVGFLGFASFLIIFIVAGIYIKQALQKVDSPVVRSFVIGFAAGLFGLALNATLIDVFEASKVAFYLWLLMGITLGILHSYQTKQFSLYQELKKAALSPYAIIVYLGLVTLVMFSPMISNYFVGDDFTWLRWAADCTSGFVNVHQCPSVGERMLHYFTQSDGFFYRPGTKIFFLLMYSFFWLNPVVYHIASLSLHFLVVVLVFIVAQKIFKDLQRSALAAFLFAVLSGYSEAIFWLSSIGHLFAVLFVLLSILCFILWTEKKRLFFFIVSLVAIGASLLFHELGVVAPLLMLLYTFTTEETFVKNLKQKKLYYGLLFSPVLLYLIVRLFANSHWFNGDYSYNLVKLPFNIVGNTLGYLLLSLFGPMSLSFYEVLRNFSKGHIIVSVVALLVLVSCSVFAFRMIRRMGKEDKRIILFGICFMFIALLPFLGLGNITSRYNYLVSFGFVILFAFCIKKLYGYLLTNGRDIAVGVITLIISVFFLLHIIQVQQMHGDWHEAGLKVNKFFVSIEGFYSDYWSTGPMKLNFVNVPIRTGEAWVFPVGLDDALWFMFKNPKIRVYQWQSVEKALDTVSDPINEKVLLFDSQGNVTEQEKIQKLP